MSTEVIHSEAGGAQTIHRCARLLQLITTHNRSGLRLVDLYRQTELTRPTAHRILQALVAERLVRQDARSKRYYLGSLVYEMGLAAASPMDVRDVCLPFLRRIAQDTGDTVFLSVRSGLDSVCIAREEGAFPIKAFVLDIGRRRPLGVGGGAVAILSTFDDDEVERIWGANRERLQRDFPRFDVDMMWQRIASARRLGYLVNDVLEVQGVRSLALPIRGPDGLAAGAISISALTSRLSGAQLEEKAGVLRAHIDQIEALLSAENADVPRP